MTAVFWDLDDTLLETAPARMRALEHAYRTCLGSTIDPLELFRSHRGGSLEALGEQLLGSEGARFVSAYRDFYFGNPREHRPFDGVRTVLEALADAGVPMAVVTAKIAWGATEELETTGLLRYFGAVIGADDAEHHARNRLTSASPRARPFRPRGNSPIAPRRTAGRSVG